MGVRAPTERDFIEAVALGRAYCGDAIFTQEPDEVIAYLLDLSRQEEMLVYDRNGLQGFTFVSKGELKHFVYRTKDAADHLLYAAEEYLRTIHQSPTVKVVLHDEEEGVEFFHANGYSIKRSGEQFRATKKL